MAPVTDASQGKVQVFDPQEIVRGETIAQWTENWWQWAFQAPANGALGYPAPQPTHGKIFFIGANEGPNAPPRSCNHQRPHRDANTAADDKRLRYRRTGDRERPRL
jgi:hypothetical protein